MKRSPHANIQRRQSGDGGISLFPFLAVLICTMGALIVLLVVVTRQARLQAAQAPAQAEKSEKVRDLSTARELAEWRVSELKVSRQKTEEQLAHVRLQLGSVEDHSRQLREQLGRLEAAWAQLQATQGGTVQQRSQEEAELARLRGEIEAARQRLAEVQESSQKRVSYAIIPYEGPSGTNRRPIYLECRSDSIVLQPEGIVFTESDFDGPLGPGNPLDVALRATREYLLERRQIPTDGSSEPYPLLLVRPSGIEAYYAARAAMKSWASDFGYELIGEDWQLEFQPPDAALAATVTHMVDVARVRQERLARAMPRHYENHARTKYRPAPYRGGVVPDNTDEVAAAPGAQPQPAAPRFGNRVGSDGQRPEAAPGQYEGMLTGGPPPEGTAPAAHGQPGQSGSPSQPPQGMAAAAAAAPPGAAAAQAGTPRRPGEWVPEPPADARDASSEVHVEDNPSSLAKSRGQNWGLRDAAQGSVPITRPIRIDLYPDRLLIVPEQGLAGIKVISLGAKTEDTIDDTISAIWDLMDSWGIAGKGMYWRPVLNVHVAPTADPRYHDLASLLQGSGLEVKRK